MAEALEVFGGAARQSELLRVGISKHALRAALGSGRAMRYERGVYATSDATAAALARARFAAPLTCVSALEALQLPVIDQPPGVHLAVARDTHFNDTVTRPLRGVVLHRGSFSVRDLTRAAPPMVLTASALEQSTACLSSRALLATTDAALRRGLINVADLEFRRRSAAGAGRWLAKLCDARAASPLESLARLELVEAGLDVVSQVELPGVGRVDLLVEDKVVVETDGREFHDDADQFAEDRRRDIAAQELGLMVARFTHADVVLHPGTVVGTVLRLLESARSTSDRTLRTALTR